MAKACEEYIGPCKRHHLYYRACACLLFLLFLILLAILIVWLVLRPSKPKFYLEEVTVTSLNLSSNYLTSSFQVTISSQNKNDRVGIYYDKLDLYAEYKNQRITVPTALPTGYLGHNDEVVWSPFLYGTDVMVPPQLCQALTQDENAGFLLIDMKVEGRLKWKVGSWQSDHYHINVNCPAVFTIGNGKVSYFTIDNGKGSYGGGGGGGGIKFRGSTYCHVDV